MMDDVFLAIIAAYEKSASRFRDAGWRRTAVFLEYACVATILAIGIFSLVLSAVHRLGSFFFRPGGPVSYRGD